MNIYLDNGYMDMETLIKSKYPFLFCVGGRGIGKTYSSLQYLVNSGKKFLIVRTTEDEAQLCGSEHGNPFKKLNTNNKWNITVHSINKHMWGIYKGQEPEIIGLIMALTTFSKCRGLDFSDYDYILYDEFIPEKIVKKVPALAETLFNCYETVNRSREFEGEKPVKLICLANSMNVNNDILIKWGLVSYIQKLKKSGKELYEDQKTGILFVYPQHSPISDIKETTVLYQISKRFNDMALGNKFREFYENNIHSVDLKNYKVFARYDNLFFYRSCCDRSVYVTEYFRGRLKQDECFSNTDYEKQVFTRKYSILTDMYFNGRVIFEKAENEIDFINLFKLI